MPKTLIVLLGPTAVGKSDFAEKLAQELLQAQIVNCDLGQFYTKLSIGVAKPDYKSSKIKQHLFDIIDEPVDFTVARYREAVFNKIGQIWENNDIPVLVGGSGFYLKSLFFPPKDIELESNSNLEKNLDQIIGNIMDQDLWDFLYSIDQDRAKKIDKNDIYRIKRALDLWVKTGRKPSEFMPKFDFPSNFLCVFLNKERRELYSQIDIRTDNMIFEGWISEVEELRREESWQEWEAFLKKKKLIGYDLIIDYVNNFNKIKIKDLIEKKEKSSEFDLLIRNIKQKTRNYAKRQITFWRSFQEQLKKEVEKNKYTNKVEIIPVDSILNNTNLVDSKVIELIKSSDFSDEQINIRKTNNVEIDTKINQELSVDLQIKKLLAYLKPLFE